MFKDTITYKDFDGNTVTEDVYFHLSEPELTKLQFSVKGGLDNKIDQIMKKIDQMSKKESDKDAGSIDTDSIGDVIDLYDLLICEGYGIKSEDGKRFIKSEDIKNSFMQSNAYSTIFMKIINDEEYQKKLFIGMLPSGVTTNNELSD